MRASLEQQRVQVQTLVQHPTPLRWLANDEAPRKLPPSAKMIIQGLPSESDLKDFMIDALSANSENVKTSFGSLVHKVDVALPDGRGFQVVISHVNAEKIPSVTMVVNCVMPADLASEDNTAFRMFQGYVRSLAQKLGAHPSTVIAGQLDRYDKQVGDTVRQTSYRIFFTTDPSRLELTIRELFGARESFFADCRNPANRDRFINSRNDRINERVMPHPMVDNIEAPPLDSQLLFLQQTDAKNDLAA